MSSNPVPVYARLLTVLVLTSGMAALSWQVVWQHKASLALGVSALGTALTLAVTMAGLCLGSLAAGYGLRQYNAVRPLRLYGWLEAVIGIAGLLLAPAFAAVGALDIQVYQAQPALAPFVHVMAITVVLGIPTFCMGATLPVFGLLARQSGLRLAVLYGLNTLGAAAGALLAAFVLIPAFGMAQTVWLIAAINIAVAIICVAGGRATVATVAEPVTVASQERVLPLATAVILVVVTGLTTFLLEVAWFRLITAALFSTTYAFALMLAAVLIALGLGARLVPLLHRLGCSPAGLLMAAGVLVLLFTPVIERLDLVGGLWIADSVIGFVARSLYTLLLLLGLPMLLIGAALPWVLDQQQETRRWGGLYALNSISAVAGALLAGWVLLPLIGPVRTAWLAGALLVVTALLLLPAQRRVALVSLGLLAMSIAVGFSSGVGSTRVQGGLTEEKTGAVLASRDGPASTISVVEYTTGMRALVIDGFVATAQSVGELANPEHYMKWMGHLPMLAHPDPQQALVICFGTGQTADAVRRENPVALDIADLNPQVFALADYFDKNHGVLQDSRVRPIVMDGRAYLRRTPKVYDVITLEPMPPNFAGVNALYSVEFYQLARERLSAQGVIAQWLPFHLLSPVYSAAISRSFQAVFPNAVLWIDPPSGTGILLGSKDDSYPLGAHWPGFARTTIERSLSPEVVSRAVVLNRDQLAAYGATGEIVTDDNQLLSYGQAAFRYYRRRDPILDTNMELINQFAPSDRQQKVNP